MIYVCMHVYIYICERFISYNNSPLVFWPLLKSQSLGDDFTVQKFEILRNIQLRQMGNIHGQSSSLGIEAVWRRRRTYICITNFSSTRSWGRASVVATKRCLALLLLGTFPLGRVLLLRLGIDLVTAWRSQSIEVKIWTPQFPNSQFFLPDWNPKDL